MEAGAADEGEVDTADSDTEAVADDTASDTTDDTDIDTEAEASSFATDNSIESGDMPTEDVMSARARKVIRTEVTGDRYHGGPAKL